MQGAPHGVAAPEGSDRGQTGDTFCVPTTHDTEEAPMLTVPIHHGADAAPHATQPIGDTAPAQQLSPQAKHVKREPVGSPEPITGPALAGSPSQHSEHAPVGNGERGVDEESPTRVATFPTIHTAASHDVAPTVENPDFGSSTGDVDEDYEDDDQGDQPSAAAEAEAAQGEKQPPASATEEIPAPETTVAPPRQLAITQHGEPSTPDELKPRKRVKKEVAEENNNGAATEASTGAATATHHGESSPKAQKTNASRSCKMVGVVRAAFRVSPRRPHLSTHHAPTTPTYTVPPRTPPLHDRRQPPSIPSECCAEAI